MKFKAHFKLEFDIKTNSDNMQEILSSITKTLGKEIEENIKDYTEIEVVPTITRIQLPSYSEIYGNDNSNSNSICKKCGCKVEGGYCNCHIEDKF